jgi:hypothetical protein
MLTSLIVTVVILGLVYWALSFIVPQPFLNIILVIFILVIILALLQAFGLFTGSLAL